MKDNNFENLNFAKGADDGKKGKRILVKTEEQLEQEKAEKYQPIAETETHVSYLGVALEKATAGDEKIIPKREHYKDYINEKFSLELQKKIAISIAQGDPSIFEGGTSLGKTTTILKMCAELGYEVHYINLNGATDVESLMGRYIPNPFKIDRKNFTAEEYQKILNDWRKHTANMDPALLTNREFIFADGKVTSGLRQNEGAIKVIILDELNSAKPEVLIRLHEVIDAIEKGSNVILSEDANESIPVNKEKTKVIGLMNPPGSGYIGREPLDPAQLRRWVYQKEVTELPSETFNFSVDVMFQMLGETFSEMPKGSFLFSRDQKLMRGQLSEVPGMKEILVLYKEFHKAAKELVKIRSIAADQPQKFTFDDREEPKRVMNFILRFYNGDITETMQRALRYYYMGKIESKPTFNKAEDKNVDEDRDKMEVLIQNVQYAPQENSKRKKVDENPPPEVEEGSATENPSSPEATKDREKAEKKKLVDEIRKTKERIKATGELPEDFFGESKELTENFETAKTHWMEFFKGYGIDASSLEKLKLTDAGMERQREIAEKYGFDKVLMIPAGISLKELVENKNFITCSDSSSAENQTTGSSGPIWINDDIKKSELYTAKYDKPQVVFLKNKDAVDKSGNQTIDTLAKDRPDLFEGIETPTTRSRTYPDIIKMEEVLDLGGLDIIQTLILDKEYYDENKKHLFDYNENNIVWATKTKDKAKTGQCAYFYWNPDSRQFYVYLLHETFAFDNLGSVFSADLDAVEV